jgi:hypothetical protein
MMEIAGGWRAPPEIASVSPTERVTYETCHRDTISLNNKAKTIKTKPKR